MRCLSAEIRLTDLDPRGSGVLLEGTDARSHSVLCSCAVAAHVPHDVLLHLPSEHCQPGNVCAGLQVCRCKAHLLMILLTHCEEAPSGLRWNLSSSKPSSESKGTL